MNKELRPVSIGLILGTVGLLFGILWAMYIVVGHEAIHDRLRANAAAGHEKPVVHKPAGGEAGHHEDVRGKAGQGESNGHSHKMEMPAGGHAHGSAAIEAGSGVPASSGHDDPVMEAAHERLTRGHLHAMGLGTIAVVMSLLLAFLGGPAWLKTIASASLGIGGLVYPFSWIVMGFKTPSLGISGAQESVLPIVALSVPLVLGGLFITLILILRGIFPSRQ